MEETFYNIYISMYLQNINVLEYAQIVQIGPKSMIPDFEGLSNVYYELLSHSIILTRHKMFDAYN